MKKLLILFALLIISGCGVKETETDLMSIYRRQTENNAPERNMIHIAPEKINLCMTDICKKYQGFRKELFINNNGIDEEYFNKHIEPRRSEITNIDGIGSGFSVCYKIKIDRTTSKECDTFIVKSSSERKIYSGLKIVIGEEISLDNIKEIVNRAGFGTRMMKGLGGIGQIKYVSLEEAISTLKAKQKRKNIEPQYTTIGSQTLRLYAWGVISKSKNKCGRVSINLVSGEISPERESACIMY